MNAIVPLNIAALRVSPVDNSNVVTHFKGRVANFDKMPYGKKSARTSTGDTIAQPLESDEPPLAPLYTGIHLHWELPDYFRRGVQDSGNTEVVFPQVPNRWWVIRYLRVFDAHTATWGPVTTHSWVVESDFISTEQIKDADGVVRPSVPVPLPLKPAFGEQPFRFMGRVTDAADWPKKSPQDQYLRDFKDQNGNACYLTSIGFLGPGFAAYYPDCCSVFGFCDRFLDNPAIYAALKDNKEIQFKAGYQVIGWIEGLDPLDGLGKLVTDQYQAYVAQCLDKKADITKNPADFFDSIAQRQFKWQFNKAEIAYTLQGHDLDTLVVPSKTICSGVMQEIVWNMLDSPGASGFLGDPDTPTKPGVWTDNELKIAIGNTSLEALSALLKHDNVQAGDNNDWHDNYEILLNALQLGILNDIESQNNSIIKLEEALHTNGFAREEGGLSWTVQQKPGNPDSAPQSANMQSGQVTLPLPFAVRLNRLNEAQKDYDMARNALVLLRKQLFMDWYRYLKLAAKGGEENNAFLNKLIGFISTKGKSELDAVVAAGEKAGLLRYQVDTNGSGAIVGIEASKGNAASLGARVASELAQLQQAMSDHPEWQIAAVPAPSFWLPTEPVIVIEGKRMEAARRNGTGNDIVVRLSTQLINRLLAEIEGQVLTANAALLKARPAIPTAMPFQDTLSALTEEAMLLLPMLASDIADILDVKNGVDKTALAETIKQAQGGVSSMENGAAYAGLYEAIRQTGYKPKANPQQAVTGPIKANITFGNAENKAQAPDPVGWNTQMLYKEFSNKRFDPYLPISLTWNVILEPLKKIKNPRNYAPSNLTDLFELDSYAVDYQPNKNLSVGNKVTYSGSAIMSKKATFNLTAQIDNYIETFGGASDDPNNPNAVLSDISDHYKGRKITTQTLSGFNVGQLLCEYLPQVAVNNLTLKDTVDLVTKAVKEAAVKANAGDNWYNDFFHAQAPISVGPKALSNFGPLRGGFVTLDKMEAIDVFGQRLLLSTPEKNADGSLQVFASMDMRPPAADTANAHKTYLPPRILAPTRLWFRWLSATHLQTDTQDFVEMNTHPATSPVCGWVMPNHLDDSLFFYNADGNPVGAFGIEHGRLKYRTRAGNISNPTDSLAQDIGAAGSPLVNPHLANFMWYICKKSGDNACSDVPGSQTGKNNSLFLADMMQAILNADQYINPANFAQDPSLAVLIGRPLAITRAVLGMETPGGLLPLNQADTAPVDPWPADVNASLSLRRYEYSKRMETGVAELDKVQMPVRLGDLVNIDDGLVGYLIEQPGSDPYQDGNFYAPAAKGEGHGVSAPAFQNIQLTLNAAPITLTLLMDPRAPIHATTGVLPVETLSVPPDQYSKILNNLQITFFTMPILEKKTDLVIPLPAQNGYKWSWVYPGNQEPIALAENAANQFAAWGYTPQTLLEGWLKLGPDPNPAPKKSN